MTQRRIKKVLLINPPGVVFLFPDGRPAHRKHCTPPLGLAYLASSARAAGFEVEVLDILAEGYAFEELRESERVVVYGLPLDKVIERVRAAKPDIIGMSVLFSSSAAEALKICSAIKADMPDVPIVLGGQHPTGAPFEVMKDPSVDYVMLGEAENSFVALLSTLNATAPLDIVPSLVFREGDEVRNTQNAKPRYAGKGYNYYGMKDYNVPMQLDELPRPAWDLFPMDKYWNVDVRISGGDAAAERYAVMASTRGCPHVCYYCTSPLQSGFKGYRKRSNENVIEEIRWLVNDLKVSEVMFFDDNFFVSVPRAKELVRMIGENFPNTLFSVPGGTEVNALDEEMIDLLAAANFYKLTLNIESGNPELQAALIDKKVKLHRVPKLVDYLRTKGIETKAMLMIGFPGETRESINRTVALAKSLDVDDFFLSIVSPLPGTPLWDECVEKGLFIEGTSLNNIRYSLSTIKLPDTTPEELENIRYTVWKEAFEERRKRVAGDRHKKFEDRKEYETVGFRFLNEQRRHDGIDHSM
jgi:anaerobic magnesium-protoporphyrin IX monomethyl ester cyclase